MQLLLVLNNFLLGRFLYIYNKYIDNKTIPNMKTPKFGLKVSVEELFEGGTKSLKWTIKLFTACSRIEGIKESYL